MDPSGFLEYHLVRRFQPVHRIVCQPVRRLPAGEQKVRTDRYVHHVSHHSSENGQGFC